MRAAAGGVSTTLCDPGRTWMCCASSPGVPEGSVRPQGHGARSPRTRQQRCVPEVPHRGFERASEARPGIGGCGGTCWRSRWRLLRRGEARWEVTQNAAAALWWVRAEAARGHAERAFPCCSWPSGAGNSALVVGPDDCLADGTFGCGGTAAVAGRCLLISGGRWEERVRWTESARCRTGTCRTSSA